MDLTVFKKIGLSEKETTVYFKLLASGASSVRAIAELVGLNRGTAYDVLKKLQLAGLVSFYHQDTKQKFVAEDPEKLIKFINGRENDLKKTKEKVIGLIPELKSFQNKADNKPVTKFYEGKSGVKFILDDVLSNIENKDKLEYFIYSTAGVRDDIYAAYPKFTEKRIKLKIKAKTISLSSGGNTYGLDERKWLKTNKDSDTNMTYILIYAGKCAFISKDNNNNPVGVIIENKMIYETQKLLFKQLWNLL